MRRPEYPGAGFRLSKLVAFLAKLLNRQRAKHNPPFVTPMPADAPVAPSTAARSSSAPPLSREELGRIAKKSADKLTQAMCDGLNAHVMERYGGIYEDNLPVPNFPPWGGYTDDAIAASKRAAAGAIAVAALPDFGPRALFFDRDGDPVSFDPPNPTLRWVGGVGRPCSVDRLGFNPRITEARFRAMVSASAMEL